MKIKEIRQLTVPLQGEIANSIVSFAKHDVTLVAVISDVIRKGRPVVGLGFNSIGRFAQEGILEKRALPRLSGPNLPVSDGPQFDIAKIYREAIRDEKPGGHGDRAAAVAAVELAFWDLNAKLAQEPASATIARAFNRKPLAEVPVYAAGGYYYANASTQRLVDEFRAYQDMGFNAFKMKIGGAPLDEDMARIDAALGVCGDSARLAVDANGRFGLDEALVYSRAITPLKLRWYEEICDPLDFALHRRIAEQHEGPIATGENLFSTQDVKNLLCFGGMRADRDIFQMDAGLSYGLTEYGRMIALLEEFGFDRRSVFPHGGHLINLHIVCGMNLGGCEAYPRVFQPFGGLSPECRVADGAVAPGQSEGFGLENKTELKPYIKKILA